MQPSRLLKHSWWIKIEIYKPVLIDIFCATNRPPRTANPVHKAWPNVPPIITPAKSLKQIIVGHE